MKNFENPNDISYSLEFMLDKFDSYNPQKPKPVNKHFLRKKAVEYYQVDSDHVDEYLDQTENVLRQVEEDFLAEASAAYDYCCDWIESTTGMIVSDHPETVTTIQLLALTALCDQDSPQESFEETLERYRSEDNILGDFEI
jgi:hypothetical protein